MRRSTEDLLGQLLRNEDNSQRLTQKLKPLSTCHHQFNRSDPKMEVISGIPETLLQFSFAISIFSIVIPANY
jgi:hypothetical protein